MLYALAADLVLLLHLAFILFVVLGGLLVVRFPYVAWAHVPAAIWGAVVEARGLICPLTPLENGLRRLAGADSYSDGFIDHYLLPLIYPTGLTHQVQLMLGLGVIVINALIYGAVIYRRRAALRSR